MEKSLNYLKLVRFATINKFLRDATDGYSKKELNTYCSEAVTYFDNTYNSVSTVTTKNDLAELQKEKRYKAPIKLENKKYYYSDKKHNIFQKSLPLSKFEMNSVNDILAFIKIYDNSFSYTLEKNSNAANLPALIRYKAINDCLLDSSKKYTLEMLHEACLLALKKYYPKRNTLSVEAPHKDICIMRSDKYGYNAPIAVKHKYYYYADATYTINNLPIPLNAFFKKKLMRTLKFLIIYKENPFIKDLVASYNLDFTFNHILD